MYCGDKIAFVHVPALIPSTDESVSEQIEESFHEHWPLECKVREGSLS